MLNNNVNNFECVTRIMETFLGIKAETIFEMKKIISTTEGLEKAMEKVVELTAEFNKLCHTTWKQLMNLELSLFEQVEVSTKVIRFYKKCK